MISVPGIGSGLDIRGLVDQLVSAERDPVLNNLGSRQAAFNTDISALGTLKGALSTLKSSAQALNDLSDFQKRIATSSDETVFTATASSSAIPGKYKIEVLKLAEAHRLATQGYSSQDTVVGTGTLTLKVDNTEINIEIDTTNNTLAGIRNAINENAASIGVSATIINVDGGGGTEAKLVISSDKTGTDNAITVTVNDTGDSDNTDAGGLSALYYDTSDLINPEQLTQIVAAEDADIRIDGQTVTSSSNTITNPIDGVTLTVLKEDIGITKDLIIEVDNSAVTAAVNSFVGGYNTAIVAINELGSYDPKTGATGVLFGDSTLRLVVKSIRNNITEPVSGLTGTITSLVNLGITTDSKGLLKLDAAKLESAIENNLEDIGSLFARDEVGIAKRLDSTLNDFTKVGGVIETRTEGLNDRLRSLDDDFFRLERRMTTLEASLNRRFSALDGLLSQLQASSDFLTQQFNNISQLNNRK